MTSTAPSVPYVTRRLRSLIWSFLDCDMFQSAQFYAERLYNIDPTNHEARHLYATSLFRCKQVRSAMNICEGSSCFGCAEIYAKCCDAIGRHRAGLEALKRCIEGGGGVFESTATREPRQFPNEAILHCRAGSMALKGNMPDEARESYRKALALDPFLWEAFEGLCTLGAFADVDDVFSGDVTQVASLPNDFAEPQSVKRPFGAKSPESGFFTPEPTASTPSRPKGSWMPERARLIPFRLGNMAPRDSISTADSSYLNDSDGSMYLKGNPGREMMMLATAGASPPGRLLSRDDGRPAQKRLRGQPADPRTSTPVEGTRMAGAKILPDSFRKPSAIRSNLMDPFAARRSPRPHTTTTKQSTTKSSLFAREKKHGGATSTKPTSKSRPAGSDVEEEGQPRDFAHSPSLSRADSPGLELASDPGGVWNPSAGQEESQIAAADGYILGLVRILAKAVQALARYECQAALDELDKLPSQQQSSAWVYTLIGRAHYEMVNYEMASRAFEIARQIDPYRTWDMEIYSTSLWHLHRDVHLSFLAQELVAIDRQSPQAWIAVGNCFSLQKEHTQALTCFRRAAQLDPNCAYAYTLSGHESVATEDYEKAISFFRTAIKTDARHYNAWYGLGIVYLRTSKLRMAEYHFRKAVEINPSNAVLICCEGMVLEKQGLTQEALGRYNQACELAPASALVMFKRTKVLVAMKQYEASLAARDLIRLRDIAPDESNVAFLLGRVYRCLGDNAAATRQFAIAQDLDPKLRPTIADIMNGAEGEGELEEDEDEEIMEDDQTDG
ncbi:hypothetical protein BOTBODRAFT_161987 [Botryobasidium botryosum FD-172 SS1]|uniref:Cdc23 domain-containing protein n=1 Tax=Botryobasidium botryosum (strain FD-172 SS1) TaxID=930990 RepID=A0A067MLE9_BOTB1|nr:hypothetical protein BOTBODRAFT_161987 [Botryobasidium botryosum FD-172 SS1]